MRGFAVRRILGYVTIVVGIGLLSSVLTTTFRIYEILHDVRHKYPLLEIPIRTVQDLGFALRNEFRLPAMSADRLYVPGTNRVNLELSANDIDHISVVYRTAMDRQYLIDSEKVWRKANLKLGVDDKFKNIKFKIYGTSIIPYRSSTRYSRYAVDRIFGSKYLDPALIGFSFKIKLDSDRYWNQMRRLNFVTPWQGWDASTITLSRAAAGLGLITSIPDLTHMYINSQDAGIFLRAEDIDKELLERNYGITNYAIIQNDDEWDKAFGIAHNSPTDYTIFGKTVSDSGATADIASEALARVMDALAKKDISLLKRLIDVESFAKSDALMHIYGTWHSTTGDNLRYLYDLSRGLITVIFRVEGGAAGVAPSYELDLTKFNDRLSGQWSRQNKIYKILQTDRSFLELRDRYLRQLVLMGPSLNSDLMSQINKLEILSDSTGREMQQKIHQSRIAHRNMLRNLAAVARYLNYSKLYLVKERKSGAYRALNEGVNDIVITSAKDCEGRVIKLQDPVLIPGNYFLDYDFKFSGDFGSVMCLADVVIADEGERKTTRYISHTDSTHFAHKETSLQNLQKYLDISLSETSGRRQWTVKAGKYTLPETIILPEGVDFTLEPGVHLLLGAGVSLVVRGNFIAIGTARKQITISRAVKQNFGVLAVHGTSQFSPTVGLRHVNFSGGNEATVNGIFFSGQLSIYDVEKVSIDKSEFADSVSDDGLNIKRSNVEISDSKFHDNFGDQFDCDFCKGFISDNIFYNSNVATGSGGDGLDLSGSNVNVRSNIFKNLADKGLSIGEGTDVVVQDNKFTESPIAIAVKDGSRARIFDNTFVGNQKNVVTYVKKSMFGTPIVEP